MIVSIGDLHLTDSVGKGGLSAYLEEPDAMVADLVIDQPLRYARKHGVRDIVLLGDLCENPRMSYQAQLALDRIISTRYDSKSLFRFHIYPGNHDLFDTNPEAGHSLQVLELWKRPNVVLYTEVTDVEIGGHPVRFLPWPHQNFHKGRLNFAHVDVHGSKTDSGRLNDKDGMSTSKAHCVIGHIHTMQRIRNSFYPGTTYQTNFGESGDKFFAHITNDDGWNVEMVPIRPTYRLHTITVESKADLKLIPASPQDLVKLIIRGKINASDYQHLTVVKTLAVKSEAEAALAQVEELSQGSAVEVSTDEFFENWMAAQSKPQELKDKATALRKRLLQGVAK